MKDKNEIALNLLRAVIVAGVVILALNGRDGWGWLIFALVLTF